MYKVYRVYAETNDATTKYYLFGASNPTEANELIADFNKKILIGGLRILQILLMRLKMSIPINQVL